MNQLSAHDQAVLPDRCRPHFAYLAAPRILGDTCVDLVLMAIKAMLAEKPLGVSSIVTFTHQQIASTDWAAGAAFLRLATAMGFATNQAASVVCCRTALPHDDPTFRGEAFVSLVLDTGPSPYAFSIHSRRTRSRVKNEESPWLDSRRFLVRGDILVIDPTELHAAVPVRPTDESVLVLLQGFFPLADRRAHVDLLRLFPRHCFDRNETDDSDLEAHNLPLT